MKSSKRWRMLALCAVLALVATACGDDGGGGGTDPGDDPTDGELSFDTGVTEEACPDAVNPDNGCIYLGVISDLTVGPFAPLAVPLTDAQKAFWQRVNSDGGIGGFDIDIESNIRDNEYNPEVHRQVFEEIRGDILALAQTLGSPQTMAIIQDLDADDIVAAPASWTSSWAFEDVIIESGTNYCMEAMNSVDWFVENNEGVDKIMAVGYPGDYGGDAAAGGEVAAQAHGIEFVKVETPPGQDNQAEAIEAVLSGAPDLLLVTTGPAEMAAIVGQIVAREFTGKVIGTSPTWNPGLLQTAAAPALEAAYFQSGPWGPWGTDTPGHTALREALADVTPNDGYVAGWVWQYPLKAAIERAVESGDLTRSGLRQAVGELASVDYEGMLPSEAGDFSGDPAETTFRQSLISQVDPEAPTGVTVVEDFFVGPTAESFEFTGPCFT